MEIFLKGTGSAAGATVDFPPCRINEITANAALDNGGYCYGDGYLCTSLQYGEHQPSTVEFLPRSWCAWMEEDPAW